MATLRNRLILVASLPTGLGIGALYLAALEQGTDAQFLFRLGATALIAAALFTAVTWIGWRVQQLVDEVIDLRRTVRTLATDQNLIREDVSARLAAKSWRQAGITCDDLARTRLRVINEREGN